MAIDPLQIKTGTLHLKRHDTVMRQIIEEVGPCTLRPKRDRFGTLVGSIISQQISTAAASSIRQRLQELLAPDGITPHNLLQTSDKKLRAAGLSPQKLAYVSDLARHAHAGSVNLRTISRRNDEAVIAELTQVKGIGRWTAQMFLIFSLGRLDVFPEDDFGVRVAIRDRYGLDELPDKETSRKIAAPWRPFATLASWYCWRSLDLPQAANNNLKS